MGKPDVYESDYLENAEIFADLINGVLYQGEAGRKAAGVKGTGRRTAEYSERWC